MVRLASRPSSGPGASAPSSDVLAVPTPLAPAPEFWLVSVPAFASGFTFGLQPATANDAASTTANSTSDLRITFRSHIPTAQTAGRFLSQTMGPPHRRCEYRVARRRQP